MLYIFDVPRKMLSTSLKKWYDLYVVDSSRFTLNDGSAYIAVLLVIPDEQPCYDLTQMSRLIERIGRLLFGLTCLLFG
jgi:hypothetical protein